ncbi:MAG: hypothetical protein A2V64_10915 [Bacteroidetes bacterium RBG_13_43_22]|nr:MAG: hypothetical protein A2V64_10915 [Bacteroidetes bacterium RBG_13_43_22]
MDLTTILIPSELLRSYFKIVLFFTCSLCVLPGCSSEKNTSNRTESRKIDSLIRVQKLNDRSILVNFGYDAVSAINTEQGIVVIDAGISTGLTSRYKKIIQKEFRRDDFIYVINTHGHHDHNNCYSQAICFQNTADFI